MTVSCWFRRMQSYAFRNMFGTEKVGPRKHLARSRNLSPCSVFAGSCSVTFLSSSLEEECTSSRVLSLIYLRALSQLECVSRVVHSAVRYCGFQLPLCLAF